MKWLFLFLFNGCLFAGAQDMITLSAIQDSVIKQLTLFPQEKIHLHTDRTMYIPGEKIWFKAYLVDALSHQGQMLSQYVYVELINSSDSLVHRVMVNCDDYGLFHGHLFLSELMPEGDYTLQAYTRYMENQDDDYFFKKNIRIENLKATPQQAKRQPKTNFDVSFFPEGGYLTEGAFCRVAFKALNQQGGSEYITGEVVDNAGNLISEVTTVHAGMGSFIIIPQSGETYFLKCKNSSGQEKRFPLPPAQKTFSLSAYHRNNQHLLQLKKSPDMPETPLYLLVHCRGVMLYFDIWDNSKEVISFSNELLPSGVIQVVLFSGNGETPASLPALSSGNGEVPASPQSLFNEQLSPISERLIFNKIDDQAILSVSSDKPYYQKRDKIATDIRLTDAEGVPLAGNVSVAVTDDQDIAIDTLQTITANLLLSSELKGTIESPGYYLQNHPEAEMALDLLMMTHGWRRYALAETIKGNYQLPQTGYEAYKELSGTVKSLLLGRPVANAEVLILSSNGDFGQTETDAAGAFRLFFHYPDSVQFMVQAKNQKGKTGVELVLNDEQFLKPKHAPVSVLTSFAGKEKENQPSDTDFLKKAEQRSQYDDDMKLIRLSEVTVTARKIDKRDEVRMKNWTALGSDETIYSEEIEKRNPQYVSQMLWGVAGVNVGSNGAISIRGGGLPIVLIDGIPMDWPDQLMSMNDSPLEMLSVHDIESIDIFKGPGAAIFGARGGNGAISITTKRGENRPGISAPNFKSLAPLGYQQPVAFYAPIYDTPEAKNLSNPDYRTTIYWKPDVIVADDGKASFDFYASDFPTTYSVVIEGLSDDGKIIRQVEKIEVR